MKVNIKKLYPDSRIPVKAHPSDAGFDLYAHSFKEANNYVEFGTGIALEIPENHVGLIFPRSSISKTNYALKNAVSVIDSNFRGEVKLRFHEYVAMKFQDYHIGDRIAQLIILPYPEIEFNEVEELNDTDRGTGGFGSTNLNGVKK